MTQPLTTRFERDVIFGFGRYVANFSAISGLVLTLVGASVVAYSYPEKQLAEHPLDWLKMNKIIGDLPPGYTAYIYETRYDSKYSTKACFGKNTTGTSALNNGEDIPKWDASLFGEAMIAFNEKKVNPQSSSSYSEYTLDRSSNVPEGIAELVNKVCTDALAASTSRDPKEVFWQTRTPALIAASKYGKYFDDFNKSEDERKAKLIPGAVSLITGILVAFLASMSSSLFAIERNTRHDEKVD